MYFRTATDLAPEITRFNGHGLQETGDLGGWPRVELQTASDGFRCPKTTWLVMVKRMVYPPDCQVIFVFFSFIDIGE